MRTIILFVLFLVLCVHLLEAKDLVVGTRVNNLLISTEKVIYSKIPLVRRDKYYTYSDTKKRVIKVWPGGRFRPWLVPPSDLAERYNAARKPTMSLIKLPYSFQGIIARDLSRTDAEATVSEGGVGDTHVKLRLKSERGEGLNYLILIFTENK